MTPLSKLETRQLKSAAQRLKAQLRVGRQGITPAFVAALDHVLDADQLVKVRFDEFKEERDQLTSLLVEQTASHLVTQLGHVVVLYRRRRTPAPETTNDPLPTTPASPTKT